MTDKIPRIQVPKELSECRAPKIGVHENLTAPKLVDIAAKYGVWHLVQNGSAHYQNELAVSELMIQELDKFLEFPISSILSPTHADHDCEQQHQIQSQEFHQAREKEGLLANLQTELQKFKISESQRLEIVLVADEMFTNAIFNAPHVDFKENDTGADRTSANGNVNRKTARLFLGADGDRLVLGCEDSYGTLNPARLLERLNTCYAQGAFASINWSGGGAGLGTYIIFHSALSFYAGVTPGKRTVVACTFPSKRQRYEPIQNLHLSTHAGTSEKTENGR